MTPRLSLALTLTLATAAPALASPVSFTVVPQSEYQSFVGAWTPARTRLCAVIGDAAEWDRVMHPAPVMGASKPYAPDATFWTSHMLLMVARVIPAGGAIEPFTAPAVNSAGRALIVSYRFLTPAPASSTIKGYLALAVPRSAAATVSFRENGQTVCTLRPAHGAWVSPAPPMTSAPFDSPDASGGRVRRGVGAVSDIGRLEADGRFDDAFAEILRRNQAQASDLPAEAVLAGQLQELELIAAAPWREARRPSGIGSSKPIFIVGLPRSGSTLIEQILATHSRVSGMGEIPAMASALRGRLDWLQPATLYAGAGRSIATAYLEAARGLGWDGADRFTDKQLFNYRLVGLISLVLPRATIIHAVREPMDLCFACFRQPIDITPDLWFTRDLRRLGAYYVGYRRLMDHWASVLPGRVVDVVYEDLVTDFPNQARRLVEACGLAWEERCLRFHENDRPVSTASRDQVRQPVFTNSIGRWRNYRRHLQPLIEALGPYASEAASK